MNNVARYHSPDAVLTEALVSESHARAASLKAMTLRNVLYGTAALTGAALIGWAALTWAENQKLDPELLREALANMPELRVAPVEIADGSEVGLRPGGEVALKEGSVVGIDPDATIAVTGTGKQVLPDVSKQPPTKTENGDVIKRSVTVFTEVPWRNARIVSGWKFKDGASKRPYSEYCYWTTVTSSNVVPKERVVYLRTDGVDHPVGPSDLPDAAEARAKCVAWNGAT